MNNTKQPCPLVNGTAVPAIRPVTVPEITSLQGGQINVGSSAPAPTQIKVCDSSRQPLVTESSLGRASKSCTLHLRHALP